MTAIAEAPAPPAAPRLVVTEPGVYEMDEASYHRDPVPAELGGSLSCSGAKWLLPPYVPAHFAYQRSHPKPPTAAMELGTAAHKLALGSGPELVLIDADEWRTADIKRRVQEARDRGAIPLRPKDYQTVQDMAAALLTHPDAAPMLAASYGRPEQSAFWQDDLTGAWLRARLDVWPYTPADPDQLVIIPDYKSVESADDESFARAAYNYGYFRQAPWYVAAWQAMNPGHRQVAFVFIAQEKTEPYLVRIVQLSGPSIRAGQDENRRAIGKFAECTRTGVWPGYQQYDTIALPGWAARRLDGGI